MRAYFFGNMYLSSIQQGIQAHHCGTEMANKYFPKPTMPGPCEFIATEQTVQLAEWGHNHKTDTLLNAGFSETLHEIYENMDTDDNPYPFAKFHEGIDALDGALTCVGIILPEAIYETAKEVRFTPKNNEGRSKLAQFDQYGEWYSEDRDHHFLFTRWQVWMINEINKYGLAR
jgi:hypothetical protein